MRVLNVLDRASRWVTVGYMSHVLKPVGRTAAAKRVASDSRNAILQRCPAVLLRRVYEASDAGAAMEMPDGAHVRAFPRIIGLVADQLGERAAMSLMGNACKFSCSHYMVPRDIAGGRDGLGAQPRAFTEVVDAQAAGAVDRDQDSRPSRRNQLRVEHSALAFLPALAGIWGLATDDRRLYDIICFDVLHFWKLGVLRMVTQRFPGFLSAAYVATRRKARLGSVKDTLEVINLRAWELGHLCLPAPTPPGFFVSPSEKQTQMTGQQWRYAAAMMPHLVAGAVSPKELPPVDADVAPAGSCVPTSERRGDEECGDDELDDGHGDGSAVFEAAEEVLADPVVPDTSTSADYKRLWGSAPLHEAVLNVFCRMVVLSEKLMGDNVAETTVLSETAINALDEEARSVIVDYLDILFGPANTTKAHRVAEHLRSHLFSHGNLWAGDSSENEGLHRICKRMFLR
eukprot:TRINITY_DN5885_c0_g1_i2.p1 TRINITY_DN5885_c0_g1~~TRINITY_DN5885_c0_g1_i2.p1  ORF type:complete len:457 (-),score=55.69 TRINITY_DN5885_c0_g1_i2:244-1614(-)